MSDPASALDFPLVCACGSADYFACAPGSVAEARIQGNVCVLQPAAEVPARCWCLECWPFGARSAA